MKRLLICLLIGCTGGVCAASQAPEVSYVLSFAQRAEHRINVQMHVRGVPEEIVGLALPAWNNLYQIRDFARFIRTITVTGPEGKTLPARKRDKQTWEVITDGAMEFTVTYSVYANLPGSFGSEVNESHAFIHPALICLYLTEHREILHRLQLGDLDPGWRVATGLDLENGWYQAASYDHLIDCPLELSAFESSEFMYRQARYQLVVHGRRDAFAMKDLEKLVYRIVSHQAGLMRSVPFHRFTFIFHVSDRGSGGMEHRNSTAIGLSYSSLNGEINKAATLIAHEFFHSWNVKKIRPSAFDKIDWTSETYTPSLWFSEGTTSYYALLTLLRTGLIREQEFYAQLVQRIRSLQSRPARLWQSLRQASIETWFDRYSDYRQPENSVSYYNKGALVSLLLDLGIREATDNRRSLDDVLRLMDKQFGDQNRGFGEADIQRSVETVAETPFEEFFSRYVAGTEELPYEEYFDYAGWTVYEEVAERVKLGFSVVRDDEGFWHVQSLETGTPAGRAGLKEGDQLVKIDYRGFSEEEDLNNLEPGREITLEVQRGPERFVARFVPKTRQEAIVRVSESPVATASQRRIRTGLMTGKP